MLAHRTTVASTSDYCLLARRTTVANTSDYCSQHVGLLYSGHPKYNPLDFFLLKHKLQLLRNRIIQKNSNFFLGWVMLISFLSSIFFPANFVRRRFFKPYATFAEGKFVFKHRSNTQKPQNFFRQGYGELYSRYLLLKCKNLNLGYSYSAQSKTRAQSITRFFFSPRKKHT